MREVGFVIRSNIDFYNTSQGAFEKIEVVNAGPLSTGKEGDCNIFENKEIETERRDEQVPDMLGYNIIFFIIYTYIIFPLILLFSL